jgi:DNA-3-methyladenine glycosylase II
VALLPIPEPYDFELSTERFRAWGLDLATAWSDGALHRVAAGREVRIAPAAGGVDVDGLDRRTEPAVRHLLGLAHDLDAFGEFASAHAVLAPVAARLRGFRPPLAPDPFEALVTSITAQQVSLFAASAIRNRLVERFGERVEHAWAFPRRERLARASEEELVALGFSRRKAEYVLGLARAGIDHDGLARLPDEEVKARLVALRGLGEWSADWYLARHLARPRAWPAGDLGLRRAVERFCAGGRPLATADVRALAADFAPFESLSAQYLLLALRVPSESAA